MTTKDYICLWTLFFLSTSVLTACPKSAKIKTDAKQVSTLSNEVTRGCIKGRVINENGVGFSGVLISTSPVSSPEVTDSSGFFEVCHRREVISEERGETKKVPLNKGSYTLNFSKDGFHARSLTFSFNGKDLRLKETVMVEKTKPLPSVVETQEKEEKRSVVGGKVPISE